MGKYPLLAPLTLRYELFFLLGQRTYQEPGHPVADPKHENRQWREYFEETNISVICYSDLVEYKLALSYLYRHL